MATRCDGEDPHGRHAGTQQQQQQPDCVATSLDSNTQCSRTRVHAHVHTHTHTHTRQAKCRDVKRTRSERARQVNTRSCRWVLQTMSVTRWLAVGNKRAGCVSMDGTRQVPVRPPQESGGERSPRVWGNASPSNTRCLLSWLGSFEEGVVVVVVVVAQVLEGWQAGRRAGGLWRMSRRRPCPWRSAEEKHSRWRRRGLGLFVDRHGTHTEVWMKRWRWRIAEMATRSGEKTGWLADGRVGVRPAWWPWSQGRRAPGKQHPPPREVAPWCAQHTPQILALEWQTHSTLGRCTTTDGHGWTPKRAHARMHVVTLLWVGRQAGRVQAGGHRREQHREQRRGESSWCGGRPAPSLYVLCAAAQELAPCDCLPCEAGVPLCTSTIS